MKWNGVKVKNLTYFMDNYNKDDRVKSKNEVIVKLRYHV